VNNRVCFAVATASLMLSVPSALAKSADSELAADQRALQHDLTNAEQDNRNVHIYYVLGNSPLREMLPERKAYVMDMLSKRIAMMDEELAGKAADLPTPPVGLDGPSGAAIRHKHPRGPVFDPRVTKLTRAACRADKIKVAGFERGKAGHKFEDGLKQDKKVCGSKIKKRMAAYQDGFQRGVAFHCGYERGFLTGRDATPIYSYCDDKGFVTYEAGKRDGAARKPFMDAYWAIADQYDFVEYTSDRIRIVAQVKAGDQKNAGYRKIRKARFAREKARLRALGFEAYREQFPWVAAGPRSHRDVVADQHLEYPIPE